MTILTRSIQHLSAHGPAAIRKWGLERLFRITASAFGSPVPVNAGLSFDQSLLEYARFTRREAEKLKASGTDTQGVRERLFRGGEGLGRRIRRAFMIRGIEEAVSSMKALYAAIDIHTLPGEPDGITVSRCSFSTTYTADTCGVMSALDDGVFSGLSGGGRLIFTSRITEGSPCCRCGIVPSKRDR
jgi:hypothetical protein